jgi:hypothetical protein
LSISGRIYFEIGISDIEINLTIQAIFIALTRKAPLSGGAMRGFVRRGEGMRINLRVVPKSGTKGGRYYR